MGTIDRNRRAATPRGVLLTAATTTLAASAVLLCAPAGATATQVGVDPGISFGSATNYGTGCTYMVNGYVDDPTTPVVFYDNGIPFAWARPSGRIAEVRWTPRTQGPHRLQVVQHSGPGEDVFPYVDVHVGQGVNAGSGCNVFGG
ncbi:hypothetical protein [Nocardia sp. NPDC127526]|uniref:hypothetical protein n=1 Tax=Nocardia sp. NPDC127526 TaxID=3345393 RepID=UPI003644BB8E